MLHYRRCRGRSYPYYTYLRARRLRTSTPRIHKNVHGRTVQVLTRRHSRWEGVHRLYRLSFTPAARTWVGRLVVICAGVVVIEKRFALRKFP